MLRWSRGLGRVAVPGLGAVSGLGLALLLPACSGDVPRVQTLLDLERLAFVPAGGVGLMGGQLEIGYVGAEPGDGLLVDRYEVSRVQWIAALGTPPRGGEWAWSPDDGELPAVGMTRAEAQALAASRGMRLPTAREWLWVAAGSRGQSYPYGNRPMQGAGNTLEVGLGRSVRGGTFASGRTPGSAIVDLVGNVWEWCEGRPGDLTLAGGSPEGPLAAPLVAGGQELEALVFGGSWLEPIQPLHSEVGVLGRGVEPEHRAGDLGLRCVASAAAWLRAHAAEWSEPALQGRVEAVGERWGRAAAPLLQRLAGEEGAPRALGWLAEGAQR